MPMCILCAAFCAIFTSCSSDTKERTIEATRAQFASGQLATMVEVVEGPAELSYAEKEGAIETQFIRLAVKLKALSDSPYSDQVPQNLGFVSLLSIATIDLLDENDVELTDLSVSDQDNLKLKTFLVNCKKGDEETIVFEGTFHNPEAANEWFEKAVKFTPNLTADIVFD